MYIWYGEPQHDAGKGEGVYHHWNHEVLPHWEPQINERYPTVGKYFNPPHDIHSPFYPLHGPYSSRDPQVMTRQFRELLSAGVEVAVVSWWGQRDKPYAADTQGVNTDIVMASLLEHADIFNTAAEKEGSDTIKIAFHLEPYPSRSITSIQSDLEYITEKYGHHECLYRSTDNRPVYYVYDSYHILPLQWARLLGPDGDISVRGTPHDGVFLGLWLQPYHGRDIRTGFFDGFYTYFGSDGFSYGSTSTNWPSMCQFASRKPKLICGISVGAGYNDSLIRPWNTHNERSRKNGQYYERMWSQATKAKPTVISVTSYNEWGEGTQIEPARSFQYRQDFQEEIDIYEDVGFIERGPVVTSEQLKSGINIEELTVSLENLDSLENVNLYTTPGAAEIIGEKAAGLRADARPIVEKDLPGVGSATKRFGGSAYYDEGDVDGDGITDSGGNMADFKGLDDLNKAEMDSIIEKRKHITTRKIEELKKQKEAVAAMQAEHNEGADEKSSYNSGLSKAQIDDKLRKRQYKDYGTAGPYTYLRSTRIFADRYLNAVKKQKKSSTKSEL